MTQTIILPEHRQNAAIGKRLAESLPKPSFWLNCAYDEFMAFLVQTHGDGYLLRPDGEPLSPRSPDAPTYAPTSRPTPTPTVKPTKARLRIIDWLQAHKRGTASQIAEALKINCNHAQTILARHHRLFVAVDSVPSRQSYTMEKVWSLIQ